jgi:hypothetical protein
MEGPHNSKTKLPECSRSSNGYWRTGEGHGRELIPEGPTPADCLIECEHAFIWIEGKRFDWLSPSTTWDVMRDQLARHVEAVWSLTQASNADSTGNVGIDRRHRCHRFKRGGTPLVSR